MGVRFLCCHCLRVVFTFSIDFEKFISGIRFKFVEKFIPKRVNSELSQSNFSVIRSFGFECHKIWFWEKFSKVDLYFV